MMASSRPYVVAPFGYPRRLHVIFLAGLQRTASVVDGDGVHLHFLAHQTVPVCLATDAALLRRELLS